MKQGDPDIDTWWPNGCLVKVTHESANNGYPNDRDLIAKHITINKEYTVKHTWVWPSFGEVELEELPTIKFNTVNFKEANRK